MKMVRLHIRKKRKKGSRVEKGRDEEGKREEENRRGSNLASGHTTLECEQK